MKRKREAEAHIDTEEEVNMSTPVVVTGLALVLLFAAGTVQAQDPVKVAPDAGVKIPLHSPGAAHVLLVELKGQ